MFIVVSYLPQAAELPCDRLSRAVRGACCMFAGHRGGKLLCLGVAAALVLAEAFCLDDVVSSVLTAGGKQDIAIQCHLACCHDMSCNTDVSGQSLLFLPQAAEETLRVLAILFLFFRIGQFFLSCLQLFFLLFHYLDAFCNRKVFRHCASKFFDSLAHLGSYLIMGSICFSLSLDVLSAKLLLSLGSAEEVGCQFGTAHVIKYLVTAGRLPPLPIGIISLKSTK